MEALGKGLLVDLTQHLFHFSEVSSMSTESGFSPHSFIFSHGRVAPELDTWFPGGNILLTLGPYTYCAFCLDDLFNPKAFSSLVFTYPVLF